MDGSRRAKIMGLPRDSSKDNLAAIEKYAEICRGDGRRMMWLISAAYDAAAREIDAEEQKLVVAKTLGQDQRANDVQQRLDRLTEDFRFLHAVHHTVNEILIGADHDEVYNFIRMVFLGKKPKKKE